jgi:hypothetical protein
MSRGLDHIVHAVHDLDAAAALYRGLGFTVGARNRHPPRWGTQNHIIQFPGCFVELLAMADTSAIAPHEPRFFSFGAFNLDFLARGDGLSMLALEGHDAEADAAEFRAAGIGDFEVFHFERAAKRPDGAPVTVAFSLAFARDLQAPNVGFFTCHHHHPENFWNPEFQQHPNTAVAVAGAVMVAENPSDHRIFLSAFTGAREPLASSTVITVRTARGDLEVMTPSVFADRFRVEAPHTRGGVRLAALRFGVRDLNAALRLLDEAQIAVCRRMGRLVIAPQIGLGATLVFEPS